jgi:septum formation protein
MFKQEKKIILASNSRDRKAVLNFHNIQFITTKNLISDVEEDIFKQKVEHFDLKKQIQEISNFKGQEISKNYLDTWVLSGDQSCVVDGIMVSKPKTRSEAVAQLLSHAGKTVELITSITLCYGGKIAWEYQEIPTVTLNHFSMKDAERYVDLEELSSTGSVIGIAGACKIESPLGSHMIKTANGSQHSIVGLPINALFQELYKHKIFI